MGRFSAAPPALNCSFSTSGAPLIPKLRGNFAEFLHQSSLGRLRIRSLPACVGFWYGRLTNSLRRFSWRPLRPLRQHNWARVSSGDVAADLPTATPRDSTGISSRPMARLWDPVPPQLITRVKRRANVDALSIDYAFRPRLRDRLTLL